MTADATGLETSHSRPLGWRKRTSTKRLRFPTLAEEEVVERHSDRGCIWPRRAGAACAVGRPLPCLCCDSAPRVDTLDESIRRATSPRWASAGFGLQSLDEQMPTKGAVTVSFCQTSLRSAAAWRTAWRRPDARSSPHRRARGIGGPRGDKPRRLRAWHRPTGGACSQTTRRPWSLCRRHPCIPCVRPMAGQSLGDFQGPAVVVGFASSG